MLDDCGKLDYCASGEWTELTWVIRMLFTVMSLPFTAIRVWNANAFVLGIPPFRVALKFHYYTSFKLDNSLNFFFVAAVAFLGGAGRLKRGCCHGLVEVLLRLLGRERLGMGNRHLLVHLAKPFVFRAWKWITVQLFNVSLAIELWWPSKTYGSQLFSDVAVYR